jgi:ABC-type nitrate/sulfonate/bicarbonate transport system substrate-binding protein
MKAVSLPQFGLMASHWLDSRNASFMTNRLLKTAQPGRALRVGFVPLCDCAPIILAKELGLFARYGLNVELSREAGWATIRDKIVFRELDAAHATASMVFSASLGLGAIAVPCLTGIVLNLHGNAITLSTRLWAAGVRDGATLKAHVKACRKVAPLVFGVVFRYSSHDFLLRKWFRMNGIDPERDVRIVIVPPPQMAGNLKTGNLEGYCVGEPWNSVAVQQRVGWIVETSEAIAPLHAEKVLMVREEFASSRADEHVRLLAALLEACVYCDQPRNREQLVDVLAQPQYVNTAPAALRASFCGPLDLGQDRSGSSSNFHIFSRHNANQPTLDRAAAVLQHLREARALTEDAQVTEDNLSAYFRNDIYHQALQLTQTHEKFPHSYEPAQGV